MILNYPQRANIDRKTTNFHLWTFVELCRRFSGHDERIRKWNPVWFKKRWPATKNYNCTMLQPQSPRASTNNQPTAFSRRPVVRPVADWAVSSFELVSGSTSPELQMSHSTSKSHKSKTKSKSVSPVPADESSSSVTTSATPIQQSRSRSQKKGQEQTIVGQSNGSVNLADRVTLVVDETRFVIDPQLFRAHPNTMLGRMFSSSWETSLIPNERGEYELANGISATIFRALLVRWPSFVLIDRFSDGISLFSSRISTAMAQFVVHHLLVFRISVKLVIIFLSHLIN